MPTNLKMAALRAALAAEGFENPRTILGSGNVIFDNKKATDSILERKLEAAMHKHLGRVFMPFVRPVDKLEALLAQDPYRKFRVAAEEKRVVTFLREPQKLTLPITLDGARILASEGCEVFTAYERRPGDPVFMRLLKKTLGDEVTTRTWETIAKCVSN